MQKPVWMIINDKITKVGSFETKPNRSPKHDKSNWECNCGRCKQCIEENYREWYHSMGS